MKKFLLVLCSGAWMFQVACVTELVSAIAAIQAAQELLVSLGIA